MLSVTVIFNMLSEFSKKLQDRIKKYHYRIKKYKLNMVKKGTLVEIKVSVPFLMFNKGNYIRPPPIWYILI